MRYHSVSSARVKDYLVHPYRLAFAQGGLYLLAYVPEYSDVRTFAVDRIASVSLEKQTFTPKQQIGDDVFANSLGVNTGPAAARGDRIRRATSRRTSAPASGTRRRRCARTATAVCCCTMNVCHDWALRSWILSWGPFARVVSPAALAARDPSRSSSGGRTLRAYVTQRRACT